jgi:WhiB family redox-sensing transcriptional regulator
MDDLISILLRRADDENPWRQRSACAGLDAEIFFPGRGESSAPAKQVCAGCPVSEECLEWALASGEKFGVWGGKSERERRRLRTVRYRQIRAEIAGMIDAGMPRADIVAQTGYTPARVNAAIRWGEDRAREREDGAA